jgi:hypothetical protein
LRHLGLEKGAFTLAYCTNIWTHHQAPVARELVRLLGEDRFEMCLLEPVHEKRQNLGCEMRPPDVKWILGPPRASADIGPLREAGLRADVAILHSLPEQIMLERAEADKPTFILGERYLKKGFFQLLERLQLRRRTTEYAYGEPLARGEDLVAAG